MTDNPDADDLYSEALGVEARVAEFEKERLRFVRLQRDEELRLLQDGAFMAEHPPEVRIRGAQLRANQILQEEQYALFEFIDREHATLEGIAARNNSLVAAGWAENLLRAKLERNYHIALGEKPKEIEVE